MTPLCDATPDNSKAAAVNAVNLLRCLSCRRFEGVLLLLAGYRASGYTGRLTLHFRDGLPVVVGKD